MQFYQHAKDQAISLICSGDMVDQKSLKSGCLRTFWPISQEQNFFWIWNLCRNTENDIKFYFRTNSVKKMTNFFNRFKKPYF